MLRSRFFGGVRFFCSFLWRVSSMRVSDWRLMPSSRAAFDFRIGSRSGAGRCRAQREHMKSSSCLPPGVFSHAGGTLFKVP